jgi:hypothetical protein
MANTATIRNAGGLPATFAGSKTGQDDAPFVFIKSETKSAACDGLNGMRSQHGRVLVLRGQPRTN